VYRQVVCVWVTSTAKGVPLGKAAKRLPRCVTFAEQFLAFGRLPASIVLRFWLFFQKIRW